MLDKRSYDHKILLISTIKNVFSKLMSLKDKQSRVVSIYGLLLKGLIMTGSNDNTILAYTLESPEPIFKLEGHKDTGKDGNKTTASR